jgi:hypothetical protein
MYYAQINQDGIVYAVTQTAGAVDQPNMIQIDSLDQSLLGKLYQNGQFVEAD